MLHCPSNRHRASQFEVDKDARVRCKQANLPLPEDPFIEREKAGPDLIIQIILDRATGAIGIFASVTRFI